MLRAGEACRRGRPPRGGGFTLIELLVVMAIMLILAGIITSTVFVFKRMMMERGAGVDIQTFTMGLAAYKRDLGSYPPADITLVGGSATHGLNEAIYYYLGLKHLKGANFYGPYVTFKTNRLRDDDDDGFKEYLDTFGTHYQYAPNSKGGYDIVSPGRDGELGGKIDFVDGYVPDDEDPDGEDDITQRSQ
ncbi:MAG: type II secretion system protein GspG [Planctomycetota bacterium]